MVAPVIIDGVWHRAQPTLANSALPRWLDAVAGAGAGGAIRRMKLANASTSDSTGVAAGGEAGFGKLSVSFGEYQVSQPAVSSRSWGKTWLEIPISTL